MIAEIAAEVAAEPRQNYSATREELLALARHWVDVVTDADMWLGRRTSDDWDDVRANIRATGQAFEGLDRLIVALGLDEVRRVKDAAEEDLRRRVGPEHWQLLRTGNWLQQHQVTQAAARAIATIQEKADDAAVAGSVFGRLCATPEDVYRDEAGDLWFFAAPGGVNSPADRLVLTVRTRRGVQAYSSARSIERPAEWVSPYRL